MNDNRNTVDATREFGLNLDVRLLFPVLFLIGIGIVMVYSASSALALKRYGTDYYFLKKQAFFSLLGIFILIICRYTPLKLFRSLTYPLLFFAFIALIAIEFSALGFSAGGSARWLRFKGFNFQPAEFARFAIVLYLAYSMHKKQDKIQDFYIGFLPHVLVLMVFACLMVLQPDFGSAIILVGLTWMMLFAGGVRILHLFTSFLILLPIICFTMMHAAYRIKRLLSFLDPWQHSAEAGYQIVHSLMAFGTGGIWGTGIGKGYQKLFYLPEPHTDFIFSVIGEELGLLGVLVILGLYTLILFRGIRIAYNAADPFGSFMAIGLTTSIGLQVCVNMGVTLGLLPTKGLTLPFLSYGGTSLLVNMASIGILMNIGGTQSK
ncbi:MAG: putative lipid II flippase FtsW [Desulfobacterales bacterium]|nr:putative lipid II flippase FtsW [Desulfobacterales bacterium]